MSTAKCHTDAEVVVTSRRYCYSFEMKSTQLQTVILLMITNFVLARNLDTDQLTYDKTQADDQRNWPASTRNLEDEDLSKELENLSKGSHFSYKGADKDTSQNIKEDKKRMIIRKLLLYIKNYQSTNDKNAMQVFKENPKSDEALLDDKNELNAISNTDGVTNEVSLYSQSKVKENDVYLQSGTETCKGGNCLHQMSLGLILTENNETQTLNDVPKERINAESQSNDTPEQLTKAKLREAIKSEGRNGKYRDDMTKLRNKEIKSDLILNKNYTSSKNDISQSDKNRNEVTYKLYNKSSVMNELPRNKVNTESSEDNKNITEDPEDIRNVPITTNQLMINKENTTEQLYGSYNTKENNSQAGHEQNGTNNMEENENQEQTLMNEDSYALSQDNKENDIIYRSQSDASKIESNLSNFEKDMIEGSNGNDLESINNTPDNDDVSRSCVVDNQRSGACDQYRNGALYERNTAGLTEENRGQLDKDKIQPNVKATKTRNDTYKGSDKKSKYRVKLGKDRGNGYRYNQQFPTKEYQNMNQDRKYKDKKMNNFPLRREKYFMH